MENDIQDADGIFYIESEEKIGDFNRWAMVRVGSSDERLNDFI